MKPPTHLKKDAQQLWARIQADYRVDDAAGLALLQLLCESFQRCQEARKIIDKEGCVVLDRFQQQRQHPACSVERDAKSAMLAAMRGLKLSPGDI